jgi:hypothetical protein
MSIAKVTVNLLGSPDGSEFTQKNQIIRGTFGVQASTVSPPLTTTYAAGGLAVAWTAEPIKTSAAPFEVQVWSATGSGYSYVYNVNTNKLQIFVTAISPPTGPDQEFGDGSTVPAGVTGDTIQFSAVFQKFDFFAN